MTLDEMDMAIRNSLRRVSVVKVDDKGTQQRIKLSGMKGEEFDKVVHTQTYGLSVNPLPGSEGILLMGGGRSDRAQVIAMEHKDHRPKDRKPGEVTLYTDKKQEINLLRDKTTVLGGPEKLPVHTIVGDGTTKVEDALISSVLGTVLQQVMNKTTQSIVSQVGGVLGIKIDGIAQVVGSKAGGLSHVLNAAENIIGEAIPGGQIVKQALKIFLN
jgi:phage baseplate assembly protein V